MVKVNKAITLLKEFKKRALKTESELQAFVDSLNKYLEEITLTENDEEKLKGDLADFLKRRINRYINSKENGIDLAIYSTTEKSKNMKVQVLFETKVPDSPEMIASENFNKKALHEAAFYYLCERNIENNRNIEWIIITDFYNFYIFGGNQFDLKFERNKEVTKIFDAHINSKGDKSTGRTSWFYGELKKLMEEKSEDFKFEEVYYFNLPNLLSGKEEFSDFSELEKLNFLDYIFSPQFLLGEKQEQMNANRLNARFYNELLNLIGVVEVEQNGKRLIKIDEKQNESLIKYIMKQLSDYGDFVGPQDKLFDISLGVAITWFNRLIFLKLFEAYLIKINKPKEDEEDQYRIFTNEKIKSFNDLERLFFDVLSKPDANIKGFEKITYLNSSLFEATEYEKIVHIGSVPYFEFKGKPYLSQLLDFLNRYDYSGEEGKKADILINASVLGLIFEKINGYKDGSYYTTSQVTEFIAHETIRRRALEMINDYLKSNGLTEQTSIEDLKDTLKRKAEDNTFLKNISSIISSIKVVDPAVGSGHFLVSALNELLLLRAELGLLYLNNEFYDLKLKYDDYGEIRVYDKDEKEIVYQRTPQGFSNKDIWRGLFNLKKEIIENQLFGVDINPNSVLICRLRLWIELLKNAYYTDNEGKKLEVLPNIETNIKSGDSLINFIEFKSEGKKVYYLNSKIREYKKLVGKYYSTPSKEVKRELDKKITEIKNEITVNFIKDKINSKKKEIQRIEQEKKQVQLDKNINTRKGFTQKIDVLKEQIAVLDAKEKAGNNTFEWAIEFPLVLDDEGNFKGFDIVIMNPPYMDPKQIKKSEMYSEYQIQILNKYYLNKDNKSVQFGDLYALFFIRAMELLDRRGILGLITSDTFLTVSRFEWFRKKLLQWQIDMWIPLSPDVFKNIGGGPNVLTSIFIIKNLQKSSTTLCCERFKKFKDIDFKHIEFKQIDTDIFKQSIRYSFFTPKKSNLEIFQKVIKPYTNGEKFKSLSRFLTDSGQGMATGNNSEHLAVLDIPENKEYVDYAKGLISKFGHEIESMSSEGKLHGAIWRIITKDKVKEDDELDENEKLNGINGIKCWVHYTKGDEKGNKWWANNPYYINWSKENVFWLKEHSGSTDKNMPVIRNQKMYFKSGFCWNLTSGDKLRADMRFRIIERGVHDVNAMKIIGPLWLLGYLNTELFSEIKYNFINSTIANQLEDIKLLPIKEPSPQEKEYIESRVSALIKMKKENLPSIRFGKENKTIPELEKEINDIVYKIYELDPSLFNF